MNALIFGGSSDIGLNIADCLIKYGYNVISTYNNHKIETDYEMIHCDIKNEDEVEEVFKDIIDKYKHIDLLINLAAVSCDNILEESKKKEFMDLLEVNLVGTYLTNKIYCKYINDGIIINMASTDGIDTYNKYNTFYAASKAGIINMSKSIAMNTDNKVLCICPNWIDSESTRNIDKEYLDLELKRIKQDRLITLDELCDSIYKIINSNIDSGSTIRIDIKGGEIWIERI